MTDAPQHDFHSYIEAALSEAEQKLVAARECAAQIPILEQAIRSLKAILGRAEHGEKVLEKPISNEYADMPLIAAILSYFKRHGRGVVPIKNELVPALVAGGAMAKTTPKFRWRIVRSTLTQNRKRYSGVYRFDPEDKTDVVEVLQEKY